MPILGNLLLHVPMEGSGEPNRGKYSTFKLYEIIEECYVSNI